VVKKSTGPRIVGKVDVDTGLVYVKHANVVLTIRVFDEPDGSISAGVLYRGKVDTSGDARGSRDWAALGFPDWAFKKALGMAKAAVLDHRQRRRKKMAKAHLQLSLPRGGET
jgi:hypothetical protein